MQDTLNFFKDRVECDNPEEYMKDHFESIKAMYTFIAPIINHVDHLAIDDELNYRLYLSGLSDVHQGVKKLIDNASVKIVDKEYKAVTIVKDDNYINLRLIV